jgi:hypothetical protein
MRDNLDVILEVIRTNPGGDSYSLKTLSDNSAGVIQVDNAYHVVDTNASASTGNLVNIGTTAQLGHVVVLRPNNDARTIVVKHATGSGDGRMNLAGAKDFTMDTLQHQILLYRASTGMWQELARTYGSSTGLAQFRTDWGVLPAASPIFTGSLRGPSALLTQAANTLQLGDAGAAKMRLGPSSLQALTAADAATLMTLNPQGDGTDVKAGTQPWKVWTEANDGAGSTLDGDTLDGLHAVALAERPHVVVRAVAASANQIGAASTGWQLRASLAEYVDTAGICTVVGGSRLYLPAGTYQVQGRAYGYKIGFTRLRLYDATNGTYCYGTAGYAPTALDVFGHVSVSGRFTSATAWELYLNQYVTTANATNGFGVATGIGDGSGNEYHAEIQAWKVGIEGGT